MAEPPPPSHGAGGGGVAATAATDAAAAGQGSTPQPQTQGVPTSVVVPPTAVAFGAASRAPSTPPTAQPTQDLQTPHTIQQTPLQQAQHRFGPYMQESLFGLPSAFGTYSSRFAPKGLTGGATQQGAAAQQGGTTRTSPTQLTARQGGGTRLPSLGRFVSPRITAFGMRSPPRSPPGLHQQSLHHHPAHHLSRDDDVKYPTSPRGFGQSQQQHQFHQRTAAGREHESTLLSSTVAYGTTPPHTSHALISSDAPRHSTASGTAAQGAISATAHAEPASPRLLISSAPRNVMETGPNNQSECEHLPQRPPPPIYDSLEKLTVDLRSEEMAEILLRGQQVAGNPHLTLREYVSELDRRLQDLSSRVLLTQQQQFDRDRLIRRMSSIQDYYSWLNATRTSSPSFWPPPTAEQVMRRTHPDSKGGALSCRAYFYLPPLLQRAAAAHYNLQLQTSAPQTVEEHENQKRAKAEDEQRFVEVLRANGMVLPLYFADHPDQELAYQATQRAQQQRLSGATTSSVAPVAVTAAAVLQAAPVIRAAPRSILRPVPPVGPGVSALSIPELCTGATAEARAQGGVPDITQRQEARSQVDRIVHWSRSLDNRRLSVAQEAAAAQILAATRGISARGSTPHAQELLQRLQSDPSLINQASAAGYMYSVMPYVDNNYIERAVSAGRNVDGTESLGHEYGSHQEDNNDYIAQGSEGDYDRQFVASENPPSIGSAPVAPSLLGLRHMGPDGGMAGVSVNMHTHPTNPNQRVLQVDAPYTPYPQPTAAVRTLFNNIVDEGQPGSRAVRTLRIVHPKGGETKHKHPSDRKNQGKNAKFVRDLLPSLSPADRATLRTVGSAKLVRMFRQSAPSPSPSDLVPVNAGPPGLMASGPPRPVSPVPAPAPTGPIAPALAAVPVPVPAAVIAAPPLPANLPSMVASPVVSSGVRARPPGPAPPAAALIVPAAAAAPAAVVAAVPAAPASVASSAAGPYLPQLSGVKMEKYDSARSSMQLWLERLLTWFGIMKIPQSDWFFHLTWLLDDVNSSLMSRVERRTIDGRVWETPLQHFQRCTDQLIRTAGTSPAEMKALHSQLQATYRSADETLTEFWSRYMNVWTQLYRNTAHLFDRNDYYLLIRALGPDVQRASLGWEWCDGDAASTISNTTRISDISSLFGQVQLFEASRPPTEEHDAFCRNIAAQMARESAHSVHRSPFAVGLEARANGTGSNNPNNRGKAPLSVDGVNPALRPETLALYEQARRSGTVTRYSGPAHPAAAAAASSAPAAPTPRNQQQQQSGQRRNVQTSQHQQARNPVIKQQSSQQHTTTRPAGPAPKKARGANGATKTEEKSDDDPGICPMCALHHLVERCPRNPSSSSFQAYLTKYTGKGHPKATEADCEAVGLTYVGDKSSDAAAAGGDAMMDTDSSPGPTPPFTNSRRARSVQHPALKSILKKATMTRLLQGPAGNLEVIVTGYLDDIPVEAFVLDTGAQVCLVSEQFYLTHRAHLPQLGPVPEEPVELADGYHAKLLGGFNLCLAVLNEETEQLHEIVHPFVVVANLSTPVLIGLDACRRLFNKLNFQTGQMEFKDAEPSTPAQRVSLVTAPAADPSVPLRVVGAVCLAPGFTRMAACTYDPASFKDEDVVLVRPIPFLDSNQEELPAIFVPHLRDARLPRGTTRYWVQLINPSPFHLSFAAGLVVGRVFHLPGGELAAVQSAPEGEYRLNRQGLLQGTLRPQLAASPAASESTRSAASAPPSPAASSGSSSSAASL